MFTKNKKQESVKGERATNQTPLELVEEIHKKVLSSGDDCLKEAKNILANTTTENIELYERITQKGFGNVKEVVERKAEIEKNKLAYLRSRLIEDYAVRYPHKKFIGTEEMDKICAEYDLVLGADQHYTGSMPERAMKEIVEFKLNPVDEIYYKGSFRATSTSMSKSTGVIDWKEVNKETWMRETKKRHSSYFCQD